MFQKPFLFKTVLTVILGFAFATGVHAQEPGPGVQDKPAVPDPAGLRPEAKEGKRPDRRPIAIDRLNSFDVLEEVVVMGQRIEGSGGRGRATVGRDELESSDQMDMDGFFDDIDGLSTLGADGEGNGFSIDGLSPDLSKVTLDGQGFGEGRGNGGFGAGDLPPEMVRRVNVYKSPAASMEEGGAGGRVNLQLRNPIDIAQPTGSFKGKLEYVPDQGNFNPSTNFFMGRPSQSRRSGFMLSLNQSERSSGANSQDVSKWNPGDFDGTPGFIPSQVRNNAVTNDQGKLFAGLAVGFRPRPSLDIGGKLFFSRQNRDTDNRSLQHRLEKQRDITALSFDDRIVSSLESSDPSRRNLRIAGSIREDQTDSVILGMDVRWRHEGWRLVGAAGYSTVDNKSDSPSRSVVFESNSPFDYDANNDGSLLMSYADGIPALGEFASNRINLSDRGTEDTNLFGGIDVTRQLGEGVFRRIIFGAKIRDMSRNRRSSTARLNLAETLELADFSSGQQYQTPWDTREWTAVDMDLIDSLVQASPLQWEENLLNQYDLKRRASAAYFQADFRASIDELRFAVGNIGTRVVATETWVDGFQADGENPGPISTKTRYTDVLPSAGLRMRIADRAALTLGAAKVMTHPAFNDMAPGIRLNYSNKTARSGNPELEPFRADLYMAEVTWAPERGRRLRINLAYRDVESYFALGEQSIEVDDDVFLVTRPINGKDGSVLTTGIKLDQNLRRLTSHLRSFTFSFAYTRNKSNTEMRDPFSDQRLPLPNTAEQVVKTDLTYDRERFSGKLSYQRRGRSLKSSFTDSGFTVWNRPVNNLNLNLGWKLNELLQFNFDARNLLEEEQVQTTDYSGQLWRITERNRSVSATLRARW
jgi:iron complex outermembrane receptor protein